MDWRQQLRMRPWWMQLAFLFCLFMALAYLPYDFFFKPLASDVEVWFGFRLVGVWAKVTEPLHWFIYGAGAWGLWKMKRWMWPWAAIYCGQVTIGMGVWSLQGINLRTNASVTLLFLALTVALWRARSRFTSD